MNNLIVIGPKDKAPNDFTIINTTSKDVENIGQQLSPFFLGPVFLYENFIAKNVENAWQFSKVYSEYVDENKKPTNDYFVWARMGWKDNFAHRYPNGKNNKPLYSYWKFHENNQWKEVFLDYIQARKSIYFPLYAKCVIHTSAFKAIQERLKNNEKIALWDFDAYKHLDMEMSYEDVVHNPHKKCGHAFVLYGLLTNQIIIHNDYIEFNFNKQL